MQVFLINEDLQISAMELDDLLLNIQCKEIVQLLCGMENLDKYVESNNIVIEQSNHTIFKYYYSYRGRCFLTKYLYWLRKEHYYRFGKQNQAFFTYTYFEQQYEDCIESFYINKDNESWETGWSPIYIKGRCGKDQITTTDNVYERYRNLLIYKWNSDIKKPKWTNRQCPKWYHAV